MGLIQRCGETTLGTSTDRRTMLINYKGCPWRGIQKIPDEYLGRVTYFKLMMEAIVTNTKEAVNIIQELLKTASLKDTIGENVRVLVS